MEKVFLEADWRKLAMANYCVDQNILKKYLPHKTEFDLFNGNCYLSLVAFMFEKVKIKGFKIPFHANFEEVNLRFYVKHKSKEGEWKRGVVFIKEIVPKRAITFVANKVYNENYITMPMDHFWENKNDLLHVKYNWGHKNCFSIEAKNKTLEIMENSPEEFITEHYWGYTKINETKTSEYNVRHPRWNVYPVNNYKIEVDFTDVYGKDFSFLKNAVPDSVFLAEGSEITVFSGNLL